MNQKHQNILLASLIPAPKLMCRCSVLCGCLTQMRGKHGTIGAFDQSVSSICVWTPDTAALNALTEILWNTLVSSILINSQDFSRCPLANRLLRTSTTAAPLLSRLLPPAGTVNICEYKAAKHKRRGESNAFLAFLHLFFLSKLCFHVFPQLIQPTSFNFIRYWMILDLGLPWTTRAA